MRRPSCLTIAAAMLLACASQTSTAWAADKPTEAQIEALKKSFEKYQDYKVAVRDLYLSAVGCVHYSGEKVDGYMEYPKGAMGVHFDGVANESDPLLGTRVAGRDGAPCDGFSLPRADGPDERIAALPQFVTVVGGAYFFLPGVRALRWLAGLPREGAP